MRGERDELKEQVVISERRANVRQFQLLSFKKCEKRSVLRLFLKEEMVVQCPNLEPRARERCF